MERVAPPQRLLGVAGRVRASTKQKIDGVLTVARDRDAAAFLKAAIASKNRTTKQYLAVVHGQPPWRDEYVLEI